MQPIFLMFSFTSITDVTVVNNTNFGSTFLVNDDGTDDDNNIDTIQLMISSPMIVTSLYIFDVSDDNDTAISATPRFLVHARVQVTFQVQTQVGVQVPYQVPVQVLFQKRSKLHQKYCSKLSIFWFRYWYIKFCFHSW